MDKFSSIFGQILSLFSKLEFEKTVKETKKELLHNAKQHNAEGIMIVK